MQAITTDIMRLPVMEAFNSLQGEGFHTGKAAYFIRLGGCDVGCHWCDVKESWEASDHPLLTIEQILKDAESHHPEHIVITGGEPLMYDLTHLTSSLLDKNIQIHLETSGVYPVKGTFDWICFSPKKFKKPLSDIYLQANELKVVVYHPSDLEWAEQHADKVSKTCKLYLQPEWSKAAEHTPLIVDYIKANPKWQMSLQTHKFLNIP